jgi:hypothetical protein
MADIPQVQNNPNADPFMVDVLIGSEGEDVRSVAGPNTNRIKGDIRNFVQLTVVDKNGNIIAFTENRRENALETEGVLVLNGIPVGHTYYFLLLMGHWDRDYAHETDGNYAYTTNPPTLLAAGLKEQEVLGNGKVTITMWPIVVDTTFTSGSRSIEPAVTDGKPGKTTLLPVDWMVNWTIKRGRSGNGLSDLIAAQKIADPKAGDTLKLAGDPKFIVNNSVTNIPVARNNNVISGLLGTYTSGFGRIGTEGSVNFRMGYIPFNKIGEHTNPWNVYDTQSAFDLSGDKFPLWIIRNGINDKAQDAETDFNQFHNIANPTKGTFNGNGAVAFMVIPRTPANGSALVIKDGKFLGPTNIPNPKIEFTTGGYKDTAEVWYAVVASGDPAPAHSGYTSSLGPLGAGKHQKEIKVPSPSSDYDVYLIMFKDGEISIPLRIDAKTSGLDTDWKWGDELDAHLMLYVSSKGNDAKAGTEAAPLATVQKALEKINAAYKDTLNPWPGKGTASEKAGGIIIMDEVGVKKTITIDGKIGYPPIILTSDPSESVKGTLKATTSVSKYMLQIQGKATVTLQNDLILLGTGNLKDYIGGVKVTGSTLTMNGGKILGTSTDFAGGAIYLQESTFTMNDGLISGASAIYGGAIKVDKKSTFTMNGGVISSNTASYGGGIKLDDSTFTMNGGEISNNTANTAGGGVCMIGTASQFTMKDGKIAGNTVTNLDGGGGIFVFSGRINKTGGVIYGYDSAVPNNPNSNKVMPAGKIHDKKGHAVWISAKYYKDSTVEASANLTYNYPNNNANSGW